MRHLFLIAVAAVLFGSGGCLWIFPGTDNVSERDFWHGDGPREILQMEPAKQADPATGAKQTTPSNTNSAKQ